MIFGIYAIFALLFIYWTGINACLYHLTVAKTPAKARLFARNCEMMGPLTYRLAVLLVLLLLMGVLPSWWSIASACVGALVSIAFIELGYKEFVHLRKNHGGDKEYAYDIEAGKKVFLAGSGFFLLNVLCVLIRVF